MDFLRSVLLSFLGLFFPLEFFDPDFVGLLAHFVVAICFLDQLEHDVIVRPGASMVASRVDGREDTASVTFLGMPREFGVVGLDHESSFRDEIHVDCIEPICKVLSARLHVFVVKIHCILVGVIEVIGCHLDCDDDVEWIGRATFDGCDGKEGDRDFDRGPGVGLGRPICFSCFCRSVRIGRFCLVGADGGVAGAGRPPQTGGLLGFGPPVDWELIEFFGVVAMPNSPGWWDFYFRGCRRDVHVDGDWGGSWSAANEATDADGRNGASAAKFLAAVDRFYPTAVVGHDDDAVGVFREGVDLVIF